MWLKHIYINKTSIFICKSIYFLYYFRPKYYVRLLLDNANIKGCTGSMSTIAMVRRDKKINKKSMHHTVITRTCRDRGENKDRRPWFFLIHIFAKVK